MKTRERAEALVGAVRQFPFLGKIEVADCLELIRLELGHAEILDEYQSYGTGFSKAIARSPILHIVSGNTPHAALQSLLRGLLIDAHNWVKLPSSGLPEVALFLEKLPEPLRAKVECSSILPDAWIARAEVVIVFSSDKTLQAIHAKLRPEQLFLPHGHRVSLGIIFEDPHWDSVAEVASAVSLFDQQGCLSPHLFYIAEANRLEEYGRRLAMEMERFQSHTPRAEIDANAATAIRGVREEYKVRALSEPKIIVHESRDSTAWTVIVDPDPAFRPSVLNRVVFLKPIPVNPAEALRPVRPWLSTVGVFPARPNKRLEGLGASRICPISKMQWPPLYWHQDGSATVSQLVRWIDFEMESMF